MGAQSLVIGKMFGEGFQFGKRKISAMPNEEFNKLTFESMMSNARSEMQASIPTMIKAMEDMKPMVTAVVHEFVDYLGLVLKEAPAQAARLGGEIFGNIPAESEEFLKRLQDIAAAVIPSLPEASAYSATIQLTAIEDTHDKRVALQEIENARVKRLQELLAAKVNAETRLAARQGTATAPITGNKKAAGQSQRLEKTRLIKCVSYNRARLTGQSAFETNKAKLNMADCQQRLTNLLNRYQF